MESDANMFNAISKELGVGRKATLDVGLAGISQLTGTLDEIEALAVSRQERRRRLCQAQRPQIGGRA